MEEITSLQLNFDFEDLNGIPKYGVNNDYSIPHIIKYMGSKKPILDFIVKAIAEVPSADNWICDLFSGSCSISAALRRKYSFISNDIQEYSKIIARTYF